MGGNADSVWLNAFPEREFARCSEDCRELNRTRFPNAIHQQNPNVVSRSLPTMSDATTDRKIKFAGDIEDDSRTRGTSPG